MFAFWGCLREFWWDFLFDLWFDFGFWWWFEHFIWRCLFFNCIRFSVSSLLLVWSSFKRFVDFWTIFLEIKSTSSTLFSKFLWFWWHIRFKCASFNLLFVFYLLLFSNLCIQLFPFLNQEFENRLLTFSLIVRDHFRLFRNVWFISILIMNECQMMLFHFSVLFHMLSLIHGQLNEFLSNLISLMFVHL